jgi:hypothetical protein
MSITSAISAAQRTSCSSRQRFIRASVPAVGIVAILATAARVATAQTAPEQQHTWEFRATSGALVPTGALRSTLKNGPVSAAQLSYVVRPAFAVTATFAWARSRDVATVDDPKLDVFSYDVGAEARAPQWFAGHAVTFSPFAGLGAGARSYNYRKLDVDATHNVAGYGTVGGELGMGRVGLRLEARNYVSGFKPLTGVGKADTRNDVVIMAGLRFSRQHTSQN